MAVLQAGLSYLRLPVLPDRAQPRLRLQRLPRRHQETVRPSRRAEQTHRLPLHRHAGGWVVEVGEGGVGMSLEQASCGGLELDSEKKS